MITYLRGTKKTFSPCVRWARLKGKGKTLGADNAANLRTRSKYWKTFLKKSFPNLSKNFT
jgi:hypothetical protein